MLFAARILAGIAGANIPTAQAFIADSTTPENRARGMGLVGAAFGLGFIFGPAIGGFLSHWGYSAPAFFAATLSLANFSAALFFLPESLPPDKRGVRLRPGRVEAFQRAWSRPKLVLVLAVSFLVMTAFASFESMFALFVESRFDVWRHHDRVPLRVGRRRAGAGAGRHRRPRRAAGRRTPAGAGGDPGDGRRAGRRRRIGPSVALMMAAIGLLAMGMGFNSPSMLSVVSRLADPADQGSTLGVSQSLASLARIVGPLWGGFVFDRFGHTVPFYTASALMLIACG